MEERKFGGSSLLQGKGTRVEMESSLLGAGINHTISQEKGKQPGSVSPWLELSPGNCAECGVPDEADDRFSPTSAFSLRSVDLLCCPSAVDSHLSAHQLSNVGKSKTLVLSSVCAVVFRKWQEAGVFRDGSVTGPGWRSGSGAAEWRMDGGRGWLRAWAIVAER